MLLVTVSRHKHPFGCSIHKCHNADLPDLQCSLVACCLPSAILYVGVGLFLRLLTAFFLFNNAHIL